MADLFVYGTLLCEDILQQVAGDSFQGIAAQLPGYRRARIRGEWYPAIVPDPAAITPGLLYRGLSGRAMARLDRFEGRMYRRQRVRVELTDGSQTQAWTYVLRPKYRALLSGVDWDLQHFCRHGKRRFRSSYRGFR